MIRDSCGRALYISLYVYVFCLFVSGGGRHRAVPCAAPWNVLHDGRFRDRRRPGLQQAAPSGQSCECSPFRFFEVPWCNDIYCYHNRDSSFCVRFVCDTLVNFIWCCLFDMHSYVYTEYSRGGCGSKKEPRACAAALCVNV